MRKWTIALALLVACGMGVTAAFAGPGDKCQKKAECNKQAAKCGATASSCASDEFPAMAMTVGDKTTNCPMEAKKIAADSHAKIIYAVGTDKYEDMNKAMVALADASESYLNDHMAIKCRVDGKLMSCGTDCGGKAAAAKASCGGKTAAASCGSSDAKAKKASGSGCCSKDGAKVADKGGCCSTKKVSDGALAKCDPSKCKDKCSEFVVMGHTYKSWDEATKARDAAMAAANAVKVEYVVDGAKVDCASKVCPKAKAAGKVKYVVNGEETSCDMNFRVMVAKAKYDAANKTLMSETKTAKM